MVYACMLYVNMQDVTTKELTFTTGSWLQPEVIAWINIGTGGI